MYGSPDIARLQKASARKWKLTLLLLSVALIVFVFINFSLGSVSIPVNKIIRIALGQPVENQAWNNIFWQFRFPKAITAVAVGSGLAISGLQMQTLFKNPLAGPFVLGISSGASLGVAIVVMAGYTFGGILGTIGLWSSGLMAMAASLGAFGVLLLVVIASIRVKDSMTLLIIGLMFGSASGAAVSILQYFSDARDIQAFLIWTFGSLGGVTGDEMKIFIPVVATGLIIAFSLSKPLNALLLGENYANSMGVNVKRVRLWIIVSASLLAGGVTAFCGPIAFIGIAVPHLTRGLFNTGDHKLLFPLVCLTGAIVMLTSDIIAQLPGTQHTLPINAITSLFGAPVVIWIILKRKNMRTHFGQ